MSFSNPSPQLSLRLPVERSNQRVRRLCPFICQETKTQTKSPPLPGIRWNFILEDGCEGPTACIFLAGSPRLCPHFTLFSRSPDRSAAGTGPFYKFSWHAPLAFIIKGQGLSSGVVGRQAGLPLSSGPAPPRQDLQCGHAG